MDANVAGPCGTDDPDGGRRVPARGLVPPGALSPLGRALLDHHRGRPTDPLVFRYDTGDEAHVPVGYFFRSAEELDPLERAALERCRGRVLEVGAGAGALSLSLARSGHEVTALEILADAATVLRERGVGKVVVGDFWDTDPGGPFDTVLALMNGTGLAGTRARLPALLLRLAMLGGPGCGILVDSTDPGPGGFDDGRHAGEVQIQLEYRGHRAPPFPHLFVGPGELEGVARALELGVEEIVPGEQGRFLAVLRATG